MISSIVAVLRRYREQAEVTQQELSKKTGIKLRTLQRFETGKTSMTIAHMELYMKALGITLLDLAVAVQTGDYSKAGQVESASKLLPKDAQEKHLQFLISIGKGLKK